MENNEEKKDSKVGPVLTAAAAGLLIGVIFTPESDPEVITETETVYETETETVTEEVEVMVEVASEACVIALEDADALSRAYDDTLVITGEALVAYDAGDYLYFSELEPQLEDQIDTLESARGNYTASRSQCG